MQKRHLALYAAVLCFLILLWFFNVTPPPSALSYVEERPTPAQQQGRGITPALSPASRHETPTPVVDVPSTSNVVETKKQRGPVDSHRNDESSSAARTLLRQLLGRRLSGFVESDTHRTDLLARLAHARSSVAVSSRTAAEEDDDLLRARKKFRSQWSARLRSTVPLRQPLQWSHAELEISHAASSSRSRPLFWLELHQLQTQFTTRVLSHNKTWQRRLHRLFGEVEWKITVTLSALCRHHGGTKKVMLVVDAVPIVDSLFDGDENDEMNVHAKGQYVALLPLANMWKTLERAVRPPRRQVLRKMLEEKEGKAVSVALEISVEMEYDSGWAVNEVEPTVLRNVHKKVFEPYHRNVMFVSTDDTSNDELEAGPGVVETEQRTTSETMDWNACGLPLYLVTSPSPSEQSAAGFSCVPRTQQQEASAPAPAVYRPFRGMEEYHLHYSSELHEHHERCSVRSLSRGDVSPLQNAAHILLSSSSSSSFPRRVLFTGDSQIRTLFRHFAAVRDNIPVELSKVFNYTISHRPSSDCVAQYPSTDAERLCGMSQSTFLWDSYLNRTFAREREGVLASYDVLVLGFGAWPASYGQWTFATAEAHMVELAKLVRRFCAQSDHKKVIIAGSPAWPKHRSDSPGFRITNSRLWLYNEMLRFYVTEWFTGTTAADQRLFTQCVRFLPFYEASVGLRNMRRNDNMHYDQSVVLFGLVDVLAAML